LAALSIDAKLLIDTNISNDVEIMTAEQLAAQFELAGPQGQVAPRQLIAA